MKSTTSSRLAIARAVLETDRPTPFEESPSPSMRKVVLPMIETAHQAMFAQFDRISDRAGDVVPENANTPGAMEMAKAMQAARRQ